MDMKKKELNMAGFALLAIIATSVMGTIYLVETGEELICRTNKPYGWQISEVYNDYTEAVCPYKTKTPVNANCSSFRSTESYQRYGCTEVLIVTVSSGKSDIEQITQKSQQEVCSKDSCVFN